MLGSRNPFIVIAAILVVLFFAGQFLFWPKAYLSSRIGRALQAPVVFVRNLLTQDSLARHLGVLSLENQSLRAQLEALKNEAQYVSLERATYLRASSYSTYPFNFKQSITLAAGAAIVSVGDVVLAAPNVFAGQIIAVEKRRSTARTVFDPGWEIPVRIGDGRVDALLTGGPVPRLSLISKRKSVHQGDQVYVASSELPLGLLVGTVGEITEPKESLFNEASLEVPYALTEIVDYYILKND